MSNQNQQFSALDFVVAIEGATVLGMIERGEDSSDMDAEVRAQIYGTDPIDERNADQDECARFHL